MSRKSKNDAAVVAKDVAPDDMYSVTVKRVVDAANVSFKPRHSYTVKGRVIADLGDALASAVKL